jgi:hypothetical protein
MRLVMLVLGWALRRKERGVRSQRRDRAHSGDGQCLFLLDLLLGVATVVLLVKLAREPRGTPFPRVEHVKGGKASATETEETHQEPEEEGELAGGRAR